MGDSRDLESREMVQTALDDAMARYIQQEATHSKDRWRDIEYSRLLWELKQHIEEANSASQGKREYETKNILVLAAICCAKAALPSTTEVP